MKSLRIDLEDAEHEQLMKEKGRHTWKYALLRGCVTIEQEREEYERGLSEDG